MSEATPESRWDLTPLYSSPDAPELAADLEEAKSAGRRVQERLQRQGRRSRRRRPAGRSPALRGPQRTDRQAPTVCPSPLRLRFRRRHRQVPLPADGGIRQSHGPGTPLLQPGDHGGPRGGVCGSRRRPLPRILPAPSRPCAPLQAAYPDRAGGAAPDPQEPLRGGCLHPPLRRTLSLPCLRDGTGRRGPGVHRRGTPLPAPPSGCRGPGAGLHHVPQEARGA